jgi:hypothetical protein
VEGADYQLPCSANPNQSRPSRYEGSPEGGSVIVVQEDRADVRRFAGDIVDRGNEALIDPLVVPTICRQFHSREPPC